MSAAAEVDDAGTREVYGAAGTQTGHRHVEAEPGGLVDGRPLHRGQQAGASAAVDDVTAAGVVVGGTTDEKGSPPPQAANTRAAASATAGIANARFESMLSSIGRSGGVPEPPVPRRAGDR